MRRSGMGLVAVLLLACAGVTPSQEGNAGHCHPDEDVFFSCLVEGGAVSVCGGSGELQYRSGPVGRPDIMLPDDSDPAAFQLEVRDYPQSTAQVLSISRGGRSYEVHDEVDGGGGDMGPNPAGADASWQGVLVTVDGSSASEKVVCLSPAAVDWDGLQQRLAGP